LDCDNGKFNNTLKCDSAVVKGAVLMRNITATNITLIATQIGNDLDFTSATLLANTENHRLLATGMRVTGAFIFHDLQSVQGIISLDSATVDRLNDDFMSWSRTILFLDGFVYNRLVVAPTDAESRLKWLDKQLLSHIGLANDGKYFKPQPWQQLQKVLREMGHIEDARQVAIAFEERLRKANLIGQTPGNWCKPKAWLYRKISRRFHWLFGWLIGYGYRPLDLLFKMFIVWLACGAFYWGAALYGNNGDGVFAPCNPLVFQKYAVCMPDSKEAREEKTKPANTAIQGAGNWYLCKDLPEEYTGFSPLVYSLDLILPLVDLQQEHDWSPMIPTPKNTWTRELTAFSLKRWTRFVMWFEILFGWMASLLLVAVVSGLTKRREE
jgi:hypothetical protein